MAKKKPKKDTTKNLKPWSKGQSGNPNGRPKSAVSLTTCLKEVAKWQAPKEIIANYQRAFPQLPNDATVIQVLAVRSWLKALDLKNGDVMTKEIAERIDGKVPLPIGGAPNGDLPPIKFDFKLVTDSELSDLEKILGKCQSEE
jgi:hypothetical protein